MSLLFAFGWSDLNPFHWIGKAAHGIVSLGTGAAGDLASAAWNGICTAFADVALNLLAWMWDAVATATQVSVLGNGWGKEMTLMLELGLLTVMVCVCLQVVFCVLRNDLGGIAQGMVGIVQATIGAFIAILITQILLAFATELSDGIIKYLLDVPSFAQLGSHLDLLASFRRLSAAGWGPTLTLIAALLMIPSILVIWLAMVARYVLIILSMVFVFIAFGGAPFQQTRKWSGRWIRFMLALIFSLPLVAIILGTGFQMLENGLGGPADPHSIVGAITHVFAAVVLLALAGYSPFAAVKMVHFMGDEMSAAVQHGQAAAGHATGAANSATGGMKAGAQMLAGGGMGLAELGGSFFNRQFGRNGQSDGGDNKPPMPQWAKNVTGGGDDGQSQEADGEGSGAPNAGNDEAGGSTPGAPGDAPAKTGDADSPEGGAAAQPPPARDNGRDAEAPAPDQAGPPDRSDNKPQPPDPSTPDANGPSSTAAKSGGAPPDPGGAGKPSGSPNGTGGGAPSGAGSGPAGGAAG